jgi:ankyrin repeat protein
LPKPHHEDNECQKVSLFIRLCHPGDKLLRCLVTCHKESGVGDGVTIEQHRIVIQSFFLPSTLRGLEAFSSIDNLLGGIDARELDNAAKLVNPQAIGDLIKCGPGNVNLLMSLCHKKTDKTETRAQIFAIVSKLSAANKSSSLTAKNNDGLTTLDYAITSNNAQVAIFMAELFYVFGKDPNCLDKHGNSIIHFIARLGEDSADALPSMLKLRQVSGQRIFSSSIRNNHGQLPIHIAAMSPRHPLMLLHTMARDNPESLTSVSKNGSVPLHLACQYSKDPSLIAALLCYGKSTVNLTRNDGFSPLHLVAARDDCQNDSLGLVPLDEDAQIRMLKLLIEEQGDRHALVENSYLPYDLVKVGRKLAQDLLRVNGRRRTPTTTSSGSSSSSSTGSPILSNHIPPIVMNQLDDPGTTSSSLTSNSSDPYLCQFNVPEEAIKFAMGEGSESEVESLRVVADEEMEAQIAQVLIDHPTIQAIVDLTEND